MGDPVSGILDSLSQPLRQALAHVADCASKTHDAGIATAEAKAFANEAPDHADFAKGYAAAYQGQATLACQFAGTGGGGG